MATAWLAGAAPANAADPKGANVKIDPADCAGFSAADAAPFLGVPAAQVTRHVEKVHKSLYACSYAVGKAAPGVAFSIEIAPSAGKAAEEMERYRENLSTAGDTAPWKGKLPKGAYSDIMGAGDEGVWTDINGAYTVRKANVTIQVTLPKGKLEQVGLGAAVVKKF
jgi:hypothetical protein